MQVFLKIVKFFSWNEEEQTSYLDMQPAVGSILETEERAKELIK